MENMNLIVEFIIIVLIFITAKKRWKEDGKFDERQILERGKAYKYGFIVMLIYYLIYSSIIIDNTIISSMPIAMIGVILGSLTFSIYAILKNAYNSTKGISTSTVILILIIGILDLFNGIIKIKQNGIIVENSINDAFLNLEYALLFIINPVLLLIKKQLDKED